MTSAMSYTQINLHGHRPADPALPLPPLPRYYTARLGDAVRQGERPRGRSVREKFRSKTAAGGSHGGDSLSRRPR